MPPATRRRGAELEAAIYQAVVEQLETVGYRAFTMEGVATAAHTGKAALYRRWPSKDELITDTLRHVLPELPPPSVHEDVRTDLIELLICFRDTIDHCHGAVFRVLKEEGQGLLHDVVRSRLTKPIRERLYEALVRGAERGEVRPEAATVLAARMGPATIFYRYMIEEVTTTDEEVRHLVDDLLLPAVSPRPAL
ncbi:TetR/AcrR family transcriptional regulator [Actinomadura macrotermitis]|uniref:Putative HTH-type transcriptional regulator n=1 Tax=Actinomadura macrotermitis TaxID=2585200 RepID=A0A7K0C7R0_9ACTN|nr:TetR/AcrR family transcriptional regulator [Actinomadura macrotermitis]MQY09501.1 putative HTH-type transcriptional regulator [Actinomadura macrotermitis]